MIMRTILMSAALSALVIGQNCFAEVDDSLRSNCVSFKGVELTKEFISRNEFMIPDSLGLYAVGSFYQSAEVVPAKTGKGENLLLETYVYRDRACQQLIGAVHVIHRIVGTRSVFDTEVFDLRMINFIKRTVDPSTGVSKIIQEMKNPSRRVQVVMKNRTNKSADILVETWFKSELNVTLREIVQKGMPRDDKDDATAVALLIGRAQFQGLNEDGFLHIFRR